MRISDWSSDVCSSDPRNRAVELFDLDGVGRSPARFDLKKLENLNGHYIREAENTRLASLVAPRIAAILGRELDEADLALLIRAMESLKPRAKNLNELAEGAVFLFKNRPLDLDEKAASLLDRSEEHTSELQSLMRISYAVF